MADTNAKTIQDLNQTTAVSGDDLVVVAQRGANEATKATVSTLAEAVGELNSTGALSELSLATSIGKNLLAQNLTNKGVPTDPSETLVSMADKVRDLTVNNSMEDIKGYYVDQDNTPTSSSVGANKMRSYRNPVTGDSIVLLGSTIYFIPDGEYDSFEAFLAAATHTLDVSEEDASYNFESGNNFAVSEDFTKLIVQVNSASLCHIYNISSSGITKIGEVTKNFSAFNAYAIGISIHDNGDLILYQSDYLVLKLYRISTGVEYSVTLQNLYNTGDYLRMSLIKPGKIYALKGGIGTAYSRFYMIPYTINEDGSVTFGTPEYTNYVYSSAEFQFLATVDWIHIPGQDDVPVVFLNQSMQSDSAILKGAHALCAGSVHVWTLLPGSSYTTMRANFVKRTSYSYFINITALASGCKASSNGDTLVLKFPFVVGTVSINRTDGTVSYSLEYDNYFMQVLNENVNVNRFICSSSTSLTLGYGNSSYPNLVGPDKISIAMSAEYDKVIFAKRITRNNKTGYLDPYLTYADIKSGAYDAETTSVPLPEDPTN